MNPPFVPNVTVVETIATPAGPTLLPLYACIVGPLAQLVRYTQPAEQAVGRLGAYDPLAAATTYPWPGLAAGGLVDLAYPSTGLWCQAAKLAFLSYPIGSGQTVAMVGGRPNQVAITGSAGFTGAGGAPRLAGLYNRDVRVGDRVRLSASASGTTTVLDSYVTGLVGDPVAAVVSAATADAHDAANQAAAASATQTAGVVNCWTLGVSGASYNGLAGGNISETYTVSVIQASNGNDPTTALLSVAGASGTDSVAAVAPAASGVLFAAGSRGLQLSVTTSGGPCNLAVGQSWQVAVAQAFTATAVVSGGTYAGAADDTYIVTVTRGGTLSGGTPPQWTVSTARGLDAGGPTSIAAAGTAIPIGTQGVTLKLAGTTAAATAVLTGGALTGFAGLVGGAGYATAPAVTITGGGGSGATATAVLTNGTVTSLVIGNAGSGYTSTPTVAIAAPPAVTALCKGDRFYVPAAAAATGRQGTLVLADQLPAPLQAAANLNLWLYVEQDIAVDRDRLGSNPLLNWTAAAAGLTASAGITLQLAGFVDSGGAPIPLALFDGTLYASYRAWLPGAADLGGIADPALVAAALGTVDPDNPLAFGVYMACLNAAGAPVKYSPVADPTSATAWANALVPLRGRTDVYKLVPLTIDPTFLTLVQGHVDSQSGSAAGCNRSAFFAVAPTITRPVVAQATSADGNPVLATLSASSGTDYNVLTVASGNASFLAAGVQPGDTVRYFFTTAFGQQSYSSFAVAQVVSQQSLLLATSGGTPVGSGQLVEVWHTLSLDEQVADLIARAAAFADDRICAVFSDLLSGRSGHPTLHYTYVAAALAGLRAGSPPHKSLSGVPVAGLAPYATPVGYLDATEIGTLCANGVWVVTSTPGVASGAPITRLATTTLPGNPVNIATREEMVRANADNMEAFIKADLQSYLVGTNMVSSALSAIRTQLVAAHTYLQQSGRTDSLGGQLVSWTINSVAQSAVLLDTLIVDVTWVVPGPINAITLNLMLEVGSNVSAATASSASTTANAAS